MGNIYDQMPLANELSTEQMNAVPAPAATPTVPRSFGFGASVAQGIHEQVTTVDDNFPWQNRLKRQYDFLKDKGKVIEEEPQLSGISAMFNPFAQEQSMSPETTKYERYFANRESQIKQIQQDNPDWGVRTLYEMKQDQALEHQKIAQDSAQIWDKGTFSDKAGMFLGSVLGYSFATPENAALTLWGGEAATAAKGASALVQYRNAAAYFGGTQAAMAAISLPAEYRVREQLGQRTDTQSYAGEVLEQGAIGAATGIAFKGLGQAFDHLTGVPDQAIATAKDNVAKIDDSISKGTFNGTVQDMDNINMTKEFLGVNESKPADIPQREWFEQYGTMRDAIDKDTMSASDLLSQYENKILSKEELGQLADNSIARIEKRMNDNVEQHLDSLRSEGNADSSLADTSREIKALNQLKQCMVNGGIDVAS